MKKKVLVAECTDDRIRIESLLTNTISQIEPLFENKIKGKRVLIKPNIAGPFPAKQAATTSINITGAVVSIVMRFGGIPIVGDIPTTGYKALKTNGLIQLSNEMQFDILQQQYEKIHIADNDINIAKALIECDYFISLPKVKTHVLTGITGVVKNTFGLVAPVDRKKLHLTPEVEVFSDKILEIYSIRKPDLVVADAILSMEGIGPTHGIPRQCSTILIGNDGKAVDYVISSLMGYKSKDLLLLKDVNRNDIDIVYEIDENRLEKLWKNFLKVPLFKGEKRFRFFQIALGNLTIDERKCRKCKVCESVCPAGAIKIDSLSPFDMKKCVLCFCCLEMCPLGAIETKKRFR